MYHEIHHQFYMNKYIIAFYEMTETEPCRFVADNAPEAAKLLGRPISTVATALSRNFHGNPNRHIEIEEGGKTVKLKPYFIPISKLGIAEGRA